MEKSKMFSSKIRSIILFFFLAFYSSAIGQGNCFVYTEDSGERIACELSYHAIEYRQGSKESQILFDSAIAIGPNYAWAHYEKSVPYFKRGLLREGAEILKKAIELEPTNYLCYRAYWYFFHRSYTACISDLERYYNTLNGSWRFTPGGDLDMRILLGISYANIGNLTEGLSAVSNVINDHETDDSLGPFDYHILGMFYFKDNQLARAQEAFDKQKSHNQNFADTYYYLGLIQKEQSNHEAAELLFQKALGMFEGKDDGFSFNGFADFNVSKRDVELMVIGN